MIAWLLLEANYSDLLFVSLIAYGFTSSLTCFHPYALNGIISY